MIEDRSILADEKPEDPLIRDVVADAVGRWRNARLAKESGGGENAAVADDHDHIIDAAGHNDTIRPLPRRERLGPEVHQDIQPRTMRIAAPFKAGLFLSLRRLFVWIYQILSFLIRTLGDAIVGRNTQVRRAHRLRETFARAGGTFIKFGQQMSIRIDLVPYSYCVALTRLLDQVDPFPASRAITIIENETGKPLSSIFSAFDPEPIGSGSIACVYQARLHSGEKVAVKVRRPGVGAMILADLRVLGWLFNFLEFTTIIRPGYTEHLLKELRDTLMEELDFYKEARLQELFGRRAKKSGKSFFSAPKVYPQWSGERVIVQEFVSGMWLSELIAGVENQDAKSIQYIEELNINPILVSQRLLWASHWGMWVNSFFHADPHPANIIVRPNSELSFIDFGSCGALAESRRQAMHEIFAREEEEDIEGIARVALTLLEPLPPIDTDAVIHAIERVFWDAMIAQRSEHSEWWEKTSANLWLGFFKVTNRFRIPMGVDHVRMIRATLLYDTLAARLDNNIDLGERYRAFMKDRGRKVRKQLRRNVEERISNGLTASDYTKIDRLFKMGDRAIYHGQRLMNHRTFNYGALLGKFVSAIILIIALVFQLVTISGALLIISLIGQWLSEGPLRPIEETVIEVVTNPWFIGGMAILLVLNARHMLFRLRDEEVR